MARAAVAAALFLFLTVTFANPSDLPPVDEDGSGDDDDDDSFSGSGYEPSVEELAHTANANKPTEAALATTLPNLFTENQHPLVKEPGSPEEKEAGTVATTAAVETEKVIPSTGQPQQEDDVPAEEAVTNPGAAVVLVPTTLPTVQTEIVELDVAGDSSPEVHNIPQDQTTESVRHDVDPVVDPSHQDDATTTEAIEPHQHHHPHHHHLHPHHHHHNHTTAASITEAVDTDVHHVLHQGTSAPSVTHGLDPHLHPDVQEDTSTTNTPPHVHHPHDADKVTESNMYVHPATEDDNLIEKDSAINTTTTRADDESKIKIPIIGFENESEPEHTDSPEFEGSGESVDTNDFVFEPSVPRAHAPDDKSAVADDGTSDKSSSKGILEQKGVLAAVIAGGVAGLVFAVCLVGFMLYRMKKKDEGSYCLEETKQTNGGYEKPIKQEEFYA